MTPATPDQGLVLVVDDEDYVRESLGEALVELGYATHLVASGEEALGAVGRLPVEAVLTDLRMAQMDGLTLLKRLAVAAPDVPVVVLTGHGSIHSAVECLRAGAADYILKPVDPEALHLALARALATRSLKREVRYLRDADARRPAGISAAWQRVVEIARMAAASDAPVLLTGESGTGKEILAHELHRLSRRAAGPFVRVNCAAVPLSMWESEFFGHRRGAFTGASGDREGRFLVAHRGTLFLDEIGAMEPSAQGKLLRVLQDGEIQRLGDDRSTHVDVRVVAATNGDLRKGVEAGSFREDLYYRLAVLQVDVPPLRQRTDDIEVLARRFLEECAARHGRPAPPLPEDALAELQTYPWPGNVRELRNVIERSFVMSPPGTLAISLGPDPLPAMPRDAARGDLNLRQALLEREREILVAALRRAGTVRKDAARLLGIDQRNLGYYVRKHGIDPDAPA